MIVVYVDHFSMDTSIMSKIITSKRSQQIFGTFVIFFKKSVIEND